MSHPDKNGGRPQGCCLYDDRGCMEHGCLKAASNAELIAVAKAGINNRRSHGEHTMLWDEVLDRLSISNLLPERAWDGVTLRPKAPPNAVEPKGRPQLCQEFGSKREDWLPSHVEAQQEGPDYRGLPATPAPSSTRRSVMRWSIEDGKPSPNPDGFWVRYEDHQECALSARVAFVPMNGPIADYVRKMQKSAEEGEIYGFASDCQRLLGMMASTDGGAA